MELVDNEDFDYYLFILAADWTKEFVKAALNLNNQDYVNVRDTARFCIRDLMSTASKESNNYYSVDLSEERFLRSQLLFKQLFDKTKSNPDILKEIENHINESTPDNRSEELVLNMFWLILVDSSQGTSGTCLFDEDRNLLNELSKFVKKFSIGEESDYERLECESDTDWDRFTVRLRPESPTAISDFMSLRFEGLGAFKQFWGEVMCDKDEIFKERFISWIVSEYESITEEKCELPNWLKHYLLP